MPRRWGLAGACALAAVLGAVPLRAQNVPLTGTAPAAVASLPLGAPLDPARQLTIEVVLALRNHAARAHLYAAQHDPSSQQYTHWLTVEQFHTQFGPRAGDAAAVADWLAGEGFQLVESNAPARYVRVRGTVAQIEHAFRTTLVSVGASHFTSTTEAQIPARFEGVIGAILGLDNLHGRRGHLTRRAPRNDAVALAPPRLWPSLAAGLAGPAGAAQVQVRLGGDRAFGPNDVATFYNVAPAYRAGITGAGDCIAVVGNSDYLPSAVELFNATFGLPGAAIRTVLVNGTNPGRNGDETEALLDLEWTHATAPGAELDLYLADENAAVYGPVYDALRAAVTANRCSVISISFSVCSSDPAWQANNFAPLFAQAAMQGQSVIVASGDQGAAGLVYSPATHACVLGSQGTTEEPAQDPNVTAVGGSSFDPAYDASGNDTSTVSDTLRVAWNDSQTVPGRANPKASGGGASAIFAKPAYQEGRTPHDGARDVPDIALLADSRAPGVFVADDANQSGTPAIACCFGGTSVAAPLFAGFTKLIQQRMRTRLGNLNPTLYALASSDGARNGFRDITDGTNALNGVDGFPAGPNYDQSTGWGEVDVSQLIVAFAGALQRCPGDCDGNSSVTVDEIIRLVEVVLGLAPSNVCAAGDTDGSGTIVVTDIIEAVNMALDGCGTGPRPTPTFTPTPTLTPTLPLTPTMTVTLTPTATPAQPTTPPSPMSPTPTMPSTATMQWSVTDRCGDRRGVQLRLFDVNNGLLWPDMSHVYVIDDGGSTSVSISCRRGAKICYGAEQHPAGDGYWGVDIDNSKACPDCCATCADTILSVSLTC
jgi:hypothetical protein